MLTETASAPPNCPIVSLYRTWRPRTFTDLVGQDAVVTTLTTALETGRLAHAYLFSGPRGSGKTSAAKILARCIECVHGPTATPDNTCPNCIAILEGTALDVLEIDAASNRGIDEIRALRESVKFAPSVMRSKVYIVDEAHMLTKEGANAFLKTLEEPPPHAVFILATTAPEALPPTILSRCQRYAFRRIAIPVMIERMREIALAEGIPIDDAALGAIAYRADGGLRDALTMLEQASSFAGGAVTLATVEAAFGTTGRAHAQALLDAMLAGDAATALTTIDDASDGGTDMQNLLRSTIAEFRHLLVARVNPDLLARDLSLDDADRAVEQAAGVTQARLVRALRLFNEALAIARTSGAPRLELETATLRFILQGEDPTLDALAARVAALEGGAPPLPDAPAAPRPAAVRRTAPVARAPVPEPAAAPVAVAAPPVLESPVAPVAHEPAVALAEPNPIAAVAPPVAAAAEPDLVAEPPAPEPVAPIAAAGMLSLNQVRGRWDTVRLRLGEKRPSLAHGPFVRANVERVDGETIVLGVPDTMVAKQLRADEALLVQTLAEVFGRPLRVTIRENDTRQAEPVGAMDASPETDLMQYAIKRFGER
jgi:DNA polymerase-3 subunit gamma/tau